MAEVSLTGYGKNAVRVMRIKRVGSIYNVYEFDVKVQLQLASDKDYKRGDNSDVVATDSMKNTVHVLAKNSTVTPNRLIMRSALHVVPICSTKHQSNLH